MELASPGDFIPPLTGWEERSVFIAQEGKLTFFHYDFYSQALAKIERGHEIDLRDVREMINRGLIERQRLIGYFERIEEELYRYPAVDAKAFRRAVESVVNNFAEQNA